MGTTYSTTTITTKGGGKSFLHEKKGTFFTVPVFPKLGLYAGKFSR